MHEILLRGNIDPPQSTLMRNMATFSMVTNWVWGLNKPLYVLELKVTGVTPAPTGSSEDGTEARVTLQKMPSVGSGTGSWSRQRGEEG